jgi:hypothetical protein
MEPVVGVLAAVRAVAVPAGAALAGVALAGVALAVDSEHDARD